MATTIQTSLIGDALVEDEVITEGQLKRALKIQSLLEQHKQLGEVLIELGYATRQAIHDTIAKHGSKMRLGEMLVEQGLISALELSSALAVQKEKKEPLGKILIELGALNEHTLQQNLAHQAGVSYIEPSFSMLDRDAIGGGSPDYLARHLFVPFCKTEDGKTLIVVSDLESRFTLSAIEEVYGTTFELAIGPEDRIRATIEDLRSYRVEENQKNDVVRAEGGEETITDLVEHMFCQAIDERASDIHIEPMAQRIRIRYRIDGVLVYKTDLPKELLKKVTSRIKIMADCDIAEQRRHQGGRILFVRDGEEYDMRLSSYVTVHGENMVLRLLNKQVGLVSLDELGMSPPMRERFRSDVLDLSTGVVIITGPTGSGKTTTLYSSLDYSNEIGRKIITVEDPVEYMIDGLVQCSVDTKIGRTFDSTLREIVRQDPDIIVLGEIRDKLTAETAINAALTGHKVYATFHTEDSIGGLVRLLNMQIEAFLISSTVVSVVAQRLLRRICTKCRAHYAPNAAEVHQAGLQTS